LKNISRTRNIGSKRSKEHGTLHEAVDTLICDCRVEAQRFGRKCRSPNASTRWKSRGSQSALMRVVLQLRSIRADHSSSAALYTALMKHLECLITDREDAEEEFRGSRLCRRSQIERWKAAGEALVLSEVCISLAQLLENLVPNGFAGRKASVCLVC
jgi:hypothetical protein